MRKDLYRFLLCFMITLWGTNTASASIKLDFGKIQKTIDGTSSIGKTISGVANKEVKKYEERISGIISKVEKNIDEVIDLKNKVLFYIKIAKFIIAIAGCGAIGLAFLLFRIWRNIVSFRKLAKVAVDYKKFDERIAALENEIEKLKRTNKHSQQ